MECDIREVDEVLGKRPVIERELSDTGGPDVGLQQAEVVRRDANNRAAVDLIQGLVPVRADLIGTVTDQDAAFTGFLEGLELVEELISFLVCFTEGDGA